MSKKDKYLAKLAIMEILTIVASVKKLTKEEQEQLIKGLSRWLRSLHANK